MTWRRLDPSAIRAARRRRREEPAFPGIAGPLRYDRRTKHLVKRLRPGDIAVIDHADIDRVAAEALVECRPSAVLNMAPSISGRYPTIGPTILVEAGIPLLDEVSGKLFELREGIPVQVDTDGVVWHADEQVGKGLWLDLDAVRGSTEAAKDNLASALEAFTVNTLEYVHRDRDILLEGLGIPPLRTQMRDRHVLVVVRGYEFKRDLETLRGYIREYRPVLVGVDGGADALLEVKLKPDIILGDMDSVSSEALACGAEIVVHAYPDGRSPGLERVRKLGVEPILFPGAGTSEDMAMLLAYEAGCDLIVAVGAHTSMVEFLEKGRPGMASTFLVRLKVGSKLVDAKGVNRLYREGVRRSDLILMVLAALAAMLVISLLSAPFRVFWEDVWELCKEIVYRIGRAF